MSDLIKSKALRDVIWSFIQRAGALIISFLANMVLARLLTPDDFGCIGIILVFVSIADVLVDGGLGASLIHKRSITQEDVNTVFTSNFVISLSIFITLFLCAPYIASYFEIPSLSLYIRIESIAIIFRALYVVQSAMLGKSLHFKNISKINIISAAIGALIGIIMAYMGFGVWSLIGKNLTHQLMLVVLYRIISKIPSRFGFNKESFKQLFGYGWFIALTNFLDLIHSNLASFIIGKSYSVKDLGYYNQAYSLQQIPTYSISMVINQVLFPYMSKVNDDVKIVNNYTKRVIPMTAFVVMPLMVFLILFAKPVITIIYSAKWLPAAAYFQILCIEGLFNSFIHINRNVLKSIGKTKLLFNIQLFVILLGIIFLIVSSRFNILVMISCIILCSFINWIIVTIVAGSQIRYNIMAQVVDILPSFLISIVSGSITLFICNYIKIHVIVLTLIAGLLFVLTYLIINYIFRTKSMKITFEMVFPNRKIYGKKSL